MLPLDQAREPPRPALIMRAPFERLYRESKLDRKIGNLRREHIMTRHSWRLSGAFKVGFSALSCRTDLNRLFSGLSASANLNEER